MNEESTEYAVLIAKINDLKKVANRRFLRIRGLKTTLQEKKQLLKYYNKTRTYTWTDYIREGLSLLAFEVQRYLLKIASKSKDFFYRLRHRSSR